MSDYRIELDKFQGPLDILVQLIDQEEMDITEISLAQVTEQYVGYLEQVEDLNPEEVADFLVVAAKLLYIKSKVLLPTLDLGGEEEVDDLERQLKIYKVFLDASKKIDKIIANKRFVYLREKPPIIVEETFNPPRKLDVKQMKEMFIDILKRLEPVVKIPEAHLEKTVSIKEKISHLRNLIGNKKNLNFKDILGNSGSKMEIVVSFLALLELVKQREVSLHQDSRFDNIEINKV